MRRARRKIKRQFAENNVDSLAFAMLLEAAINVQENEIAYKYFLDGKDFYKMNPEEKKEVLCNELFC